jgi:hypothetical protein
MSSPARTDRTTFFRLSTNDERCDARLDTEGTLALTGNWTQSGIRGSFTDLRSSVQEIASEPRRAAPTTHRAPSPRSNRHFPS